MTKAQKTSYLLFALFIVCGSAFWLLHKLPEEIITAKYKDDIYSSEINMSFLSDSSYVMKHQYRDLYDSLIKKEIKGTYRLWRDSLFFKGGLDSLGVRKATIKNNMIEFPANDIEGFSITSTTLDLKPIIHPEKYPDYIIYTYKPEHDPYFGEDAKPYDLLEKDMTELIHILETCPKDECQPKGRNYIKKCYAVINSAGEKEVVVISNLKPDAPSEPDGYCYSAVNINLSKRECRPVVCFGG